MDKRTRSGVASKTAFEFLAVESGEESELSDEEPVEVSVPELGPAKESPIPKLTRTAQKKAAKAAKLAKQRTSSLTAAPMTETLSEVVGGHPDGTQFNPVEVPSDTPIRVSSPEPVLPAAAEITEKSGASASLTTVNGDSKQNASSKHSEGLVNDPAKAHATGMENSVPRKSSLLLPTVRPLEEKVDQARQAVSEAVGPNNAERSKKVQSILTRTLWTFVMIGGFITLLAMGHVYMILLVMLCQTVVYREVTALFSLKSRDDDISNSVAEVHKTKDPWSKTLNWYFFAVTNYFLYGESIIYYFKHVVFADAQLLPFATNHRFISFSLYIIGFVGFVMSLKKGYLKQQFGLFCWVHMTLFVIVVSSHFIVNNILEGMIWFFVPASLVICNDIFAYIWGMSMGHTPLIALSPKKTVEGFVGAFWSTIIFGVMWGTLFMRADYMICPVRDLGVSAWSDVTCTPNPIFIWRDYPIPPPLAATLSTLVGTTIRTIPYAPYQFHLLALSCFASLVAPFGGFFASGFKRAFDIKDFGSSIPGHGGMTDRMDCQFLMGVFTYVYYTSLVRDHHVTVGSVLQTIITGLTVEEQMELLGGLKHYWESQGIDISAIPKAILRR